MVVGDDGSALPLLRKEVQKLRDRLAERTPLADVELREAKRHAAEGRAAVEKTRLLWDEKLAAVAREHELARQDDAERIGRYEKRIAEDDKRIGALERELAALKAAAAEQAAAVTAAARRVAGESAAAPETLAALLQRLDLRGHLSALEEEELD
eukprot:3886284-Prymnesium_polylepis.1